LEGVAQNHSFVQIHVLNSNCGNCDDAGSGIRGARDVADNRLFPLFTSWTVASESFCATTCSQSAVDVIFFLKYWRLGSIAFEIFGIELRIIALAIYTHIGPFML